MQYYPLAEKFIKDTFKGTPHEQDITHFERTVFWLKQLDQQADEAMCIAAFGHDAERAFRGEEVENRLAASSKGFTDEEHLKHHQETGARVMADFLKGQKAPFELVEKVSRLISKHEVGGEEDENLLKDADSLSYFENQVEYFLQNKLAKMGKEKIKAKFDWMFERITSPKARELAEPMYLEAIKKLEII
jgi:hypothetical protein